MNKLPVVILLMLSMNCYAQDSLLIKLLNEKKYTLLPTENSFVGKGWQKIDSAVKASNNVLIGEDHFFNEIPLFISAIANQNSFQNFVIEIDPYSADIVSNSINLLSSSDFEKFKAEFGSTFSFYALASEMKLLKLMAEKNVTVMGTDQVMLVADRLLCNNLKKISKSTEAKKLYDFIEMESARHLNEFLKDQNKPFYMLTPAFDSLITKLLKLPLSEREREQVEAMKLSKRIYMEQSHALRIQLMKNTFYERYYSKLNKQKNLFKFGAGHMSKGEALLGGYDLGNIVYNIADSHYEKSVHIAVFGKEGMQGSPFNGVSPGKLDPVNGELKSLKPFFNTMHTKDWYCFDLTEIQRAIRRGTLTVDDLFLRRILQGYDYLVIIPEVTASSFNR